MHNLLYLLNIAPKPIVDDVTSLFTSIALLVAAVGAVLLAVIKVYKDAKKEIDALPKKIKKQSSIDIDMTQMMEDVKELVNADRVQIYDFHNGGHYANGRSALKTSCTYEITRIGIHPKQVHLQGIPLSCIPRFVNKLLEEGSMEVKDILEIKDTMPATYELKKSQGINSFYDIVLNNKYGEPIGFLAIQYVKNKYHLSRDSDKQEVLKLKFFVEKQLELMNVK